MARLLPVNNGLVNELAHLGAPEQAAGVRHGIESALAATAGLPDGHKVIESRVWSIWSTSSPASGPRCHVSTTTGPSRSTTQKSMTTALMGRR